MLLLLIFKVLFLCSVAAILLLLLLRELPFKELKVERRPVVLQLPLRKGKAGGGGVGGMGDVEGLAL